MKRLIRFFSALMLILALASCEEEKQVYNVNYYINSEYIGFTSVKEGDALPVEFDDIYFDELFLSLSEYIRKNNIEYDEFDGWYTDINYTFKVEEDYVVKKKVSLYGKLISDSIENPSNPSEPSEPGEANDPYYSAAAGLTGEPLKAALNDIITETHTKKLTYSEVWAALLKTDKGQADNTVICIYTGVEFNYAHRDGASSGASKVWNREHVWPNSKGFSTKTHTAYSDIHHLFPSEKNINASRGNSDFGEIKGTSYSSDSYGNKWTASLFEPRDEVKGDLARALFYMLVRYDGETTNCGYSDCTLDLELVTGSSSSSSNSAGKSGYLGDLNYLIKWHYEDPVSDYELARNEAIYGIQGNRNPFIDHPEYILALYPEIAGQYA